MSKPEITFIPGDELQPNRWNRKHFNPDALTDLAASIAAQGIVQPLVVREITDPAPKVKMKFPRYEIVAGERRWRAAALAKLAEVPCIVKALDDRAARELCAIENLQREDLTALEEAQSYRELMDECQCKVEDLEARLGRKRSHIYARLRLLTLPAGVKQAIGEGQIEASIGELIATIPDDKQREAALKEILNGEYHRDFETGKETRLPLSYRKAKALVEEDFRKSLKKAPFDLKAENLAGEVSCASCPLRTGNLPGLPSGSSPDVCTAPACYARKVTAYQDQLLAGLKAKGKTVLSGKDAPKWQYGGLAYNCGYVEADGHHYVNGKQRPYSELLGKQMPELLHAVNPEGEVVALCREKDIKAALVAAKVIQPVERDKPESPAAKAKRLLDEKVEPLVLERLVAGLLKPIEQGKGTLGLARFVIDQLDNGDWINHDVLTRRRKWSNLIEPARKLGEREMLGLVAEAFLADSYGGTYNEDLIEALGKHLGVKLDRKAIEKEVRAELVAAEQPTAKEAKPEKKAAAVKPKTKARK